jgi:hypothetical protein
MEAQPTQEQAQPTTPEQAQPTPEEAQPEQKNKRNQHLSSNDMQQQRIELLKTAEPQVVTGYKDRYPDDWKRLEQHSPAEMERIKQRVFTPRQQPVESSPELIGFII